jgi:hypothetical protein
MTDANPDLASEASEDLTTVDQIVMLGLAVIPIVIATWWHITQVVPV